jgi:hypothetical protein
MDITAYVFLALGALVLAFAGFHGFPNKSVTVVSFGLGAFLIIVAGCCYWQGALWEEEEVSQSKNVTPTAQPVPQIDRPWLAVVEVRAKGPLTFIDEKVNHIASLPVEWVVKNTGRGTANGVTVKADLFYPSRADPFAGEEVLQRQKEVCEKPWRDPGVTIFPDATHTFSMEFVMGIKEMEAAGLAFKEANKWAPNLDGKDVRPCLVGCVYYTFGDSFYGETGFAYDIAGNADAVVVSGGSSTLRIGRNLPADKVEFQKFPNGGDYAKHERLATPTPRTSQKDAASTGQRAWVAVTEVKSDVREGQNFKVRVTFKNSGYTLATEVGVKLVVQMVPSSIVPEFNDEDVEIKSAGILSPDGICYGNQTTTLILTREHVDSIRLGATSVYVYGRVVYTDIFTHPHWTMFCFKLHADGKDPGEVSYVAYGTRNNRTDDNP